MSGLTDFAPRWKALMKVEVQPSGKAATKPSLLDLVILAAATPIMYQPSGGVPKKLAKLAPISQPPACSKITLGYFFERSRAGYWWLNAVAMIISAPCWIMFSIVVVAPASSGTFSASMIFTQLMLVW